MRESRADTGRALGYALLLHALMFAAMFAGLWWTRSAAPLSVAGAPIEAELIDAGDLSAKMQRVLRQRPEPVQPYPQPLPEPVEEQAAPLPQPLPEPAPQDAATPQQRQAQERVAEPAPVEQEEVRADAISADIREREQEARRKQEQIDLTERERAAAAEQQRRLAAQQDAQRQQQLDEIRKQREKLSREIQQREARLQQIADRNAALASQQQAQQPSRQAGAVSGNNGENDADLRARYVAAIQRVVQSNWTRPDNVPDLPCRVTIVQLPGGEVISAEVEAGCPYDDLGKRSVEAAVLKAQPLPYAGYESVFDRRLNFTFRPAPGQ